MNMPQSSEAPGKLQYLQRQQLTFSVLNLVALATLLLIHTFFSDHFGIPSTRLIMVLAGAFLLRVIELLWTQSRTSLFSDSMVIALTWASVIFNLALAFIAAMLTNRPDAQYFVLLAMPIIEAAFRFRLLTTVVIILAAAAVNFLWVFDYARYRHGAVLPTEYFETGTISMVYAFVGILVWMLVTDLRRNQTELARNLSELEQTKERLVMEEKLGAIGRLSSAIAHEIRNPVAMISTSLATAERGGIDTEQRQAMYQIAMQESTRLEQLTNDFLTYARPREPVKTVNNAADLLKYVASLSRAHAESKQINLAVDAAEELWCECDSSGLEQVLLNLAMNAVDASPQNGTVTLHGRHLEPWICLEIENTGPSIEPDVCARIFEPFFTTKPKGTGLGLAISRNLARSQGGDVTLTMNGPEHVTFTVRMPAATPLAAAGQWRVYGANTRS